MVALSSTIKTRLPRSSSSRTSQAGRALVIGCFSGTVNQNREPAPGVLSTPISPPIKCTNRREMANPSPVPPKRRLVELSAWVKESKILAWTSGAMPMPVSSTAKYSRGVVSPSACTRIRITTSPFSVNLMALPTRLTKSCRTRTGSPCTLAGRSIGRSLIKSSPFSCARPASIAAMSSTSSRGSNKVISNSSRPASILEKSRISLMVASRAQPELWIRLANRSCWGFRAVPSSRSAIPSTPFRGVRISWLITARNSDLARLAASAASLASRRTRCASTWCSRSCKRAAISSNAVAT